MPQNTSNPADKPLADVDQPPRRKVLVTGAAGRIGSYFCEHGHEKYDLRMMVRKAKKASRVEDFGQVVIGELSETDKLATACEGVDTVLHLAADPRANAGWDTLLPSNIVGTYNVVRAALDAGCRRLIVASSIHAVSGYPADVQVKPDEPVNPGDLYGVSKCFMEALGRWAAEQHGLSCIAVRIGAFQPRTAAADAGGVRMLDAFISRRDLHQLLERAIDAEGIDFAIVHGLSDNRFKRMDISTARELLGYQPQDDLTELNEQVRALHLNDQVQAHRGSGVD